MWLKCHSSRIAGENPACAIPPIETRYYMPDIKFDGIDIDPEKLKLPEVQELFKDIERISKTIDKRLKESRLEIYNIGEKVHHKQILFHQSLKRMKAFFGGNRVGKTVAGAVEAVSHATGYSRFRKLTPSSGWVVSLTNEVQRDVAQKEILTWLPKSEIKDYVIRHGRKDDPANSIIDKIILKNGCTIGFKTCEQGRESFQGTSQGWIWFDEEPPLEIFQECQMRILDTCGDIWFTMTPLKGLTFVYNLIYLNERNDPDVEYWMAEWEDNPWLSQAEINKLVSTMTDEEREARQYGRFTSLCGFAFPELRKDIHLVKPVSAIPDYYKRFVCLDYGLDATAALWIYLDTQNKARIYRQFFKKNLIVSEAAKAILRLNGNEKNHTYYAPPDLWNRRNDTGKSAFTIFHENGINLVKTSNERESGWMAVKEWIRPYDTKDEITGEIYRTASLTIDEGCAPYLWKSMTNLQRDDKNPNDIDSKTNHDLTHLPDALRCFCVSRQSPAVIPVEKVYEHGKVYVYGELRQKGLSDAKIRQMERNGEVKVLAMPSKK
jgi:phage terminase large subunit-like protein